ncbi:MAG: hypothetical protein Q4B47_04190 [Eubacteriales bacterium]|nr:hypothetical protein [Eubacteriales bacterium]
MKKMKIQKLLAVVFMGTMFLSMTACGTSKDTKEEKIEKTTEKTVEETTEEPAKETAETIAEESAKETAETIAEENEAKSSDENDNTVQIPNPFVEVTSLEEAKEIAGFSMDAPDTIDGYNDKNISVLNIDDKMIQVTYSKDEKELLIRKGTIGTDGVTDISGDYTEYSEKSELEVNGTKAAVRGNSGKVYVATWSDEKFNYSIGSTEGLTQEKVTELLTQIK